MCGDSGIYVGVHVITIDLMLGAEKLMIDETLLCRDEVKEEKDLEKYANFYFLLHFWMTNIEEGKELSSFFKKRGYKTVAIYGMAALGNHLKRQLPEELQPVYTIDRGIITYEDQRLIMEENIIKIIKPDVIIVTPIMEYSVIKEKIRSLIDVDVVSLEELILSL